LKELFAIAPEISQPLAGAIRIRVLVVAGIRLYREGLSEILDRESHVSVVGMARDRREGLAMIEELRPDVALLDLDIPEICALMETVREVAPAVRVVALGMLEEDERVIACVEAGMAGYVPRDASTGDLVKRVESAARGEMEISPTVAARLARRVVALAGALRAERGHPALTSRETEIVELIDEGLTNKQIAQRLCIELPTVKNHVHHILGKLEVTRRAEAAACVRRAALNR
jgi:two-component system nitrate/nitrite response regulator NarL